MAGIPAGGSRPAIEYVLWVDADGSILVSRFPGLDPVGAPVGFFTPFALTVPPPELAQRPVPGTSRVTAVGTDRFFWVAWVGADDMVHSEQHDADTIGLIRPMQTLGPARRDSALASAVVAGIPALAWVTPDGRLGVEFATPSGTRLGAAGSARPDTPIALVTVRPTTTHALWVAADGTLMASTSRLPIFAAQWSEPAPIRDEAGIPAAVARGDTLTATEVDGTPEAVWLDPAGALRHARFEGDRWGAARLLLAAGPARAGGPVRALSDSTSGTLEVLFATPGGGIGAAVRDIGPPVTLAGPTGGGATGLAVCSLGEGGRAAAWMTADGSVVRARRRAASFGAPGTDPPPTALQVDGQARIDPAFARCDLRLRHADAADAFWVRPDGALGVLSGRRFAAGSPFIPAGWRWRAAAVARPGLGRTSPPGAVARLPRDPTGFALLWVQPDGSVRSIDFDGTDLVESPQWRLPAQVAPPGSAVADRPAVAATPGPAGAPAGEEWAFWLVPAGKIGVARRDDANATWTLQTPPEASARADSTLLAGTLPGRVILVWVDFTGVPVFASKSAGSNWTQQPAPANKRVFTVARRGRLVAAAADAGTGARVAWVDVDGAVRAALIDGGAWGDAVQLSDPGVADALSLSLLQADAALAWLLPDGTVVQEGRGSISAPAAARTVLGSVALPQGGTVLIVAMPDGNLGTLQRGSS